MFPAATCSLYIVCLRWSDSPLNLSCHLAPLALHLHTAEWNKIPFLAPPKKERIQEMKVVTRSWLCQTSPWAGTKGPEKSCWAYFSQQMTEVKGEEGNTDGRRWIAKRDIRKLRSSLFLVCACHYNVKMSRSGCCWDKLCCLKNCSPLCTEPHIPQICKHQAK